MKPIVLEIPGRPVPYQRTRTGARGGRFDDPRYRDYKTLVRQITMLERFDPFPDGTQVSAEIVVSADALTVELVPWEGERMRPKHIRGDLDNYVKAAMDSLQRNGRHGFPAGPFDDDRNLIAVRARFRP